MFGIAQIGMIDKLNTKGSNSLIDYLKNIHSESVYLEGS